MSASLLEARGVGRDFGGLTALRAIDWCVREGCVKALIGPNGAGKTTLLSIVAGALVPTRGRVWLAGELLPPGRPHVAAARGIARTFQLVRLFGDMTVLENVLVGAHRRGTAGWLASALRTPAMRAEEIELREAALEALATVGLAHRAGAPAVTLTYGEQRLVEVARALAMRPRLLLLDEPGAGLDDDEHHRLGALLAEMRARGVTIVLVDHHVEFVMDVADEVTVLHHGEALADGPPETVRRDAEVIAAYLGEEVA